MDPNGWVVCWRVGHDEHGRTRWTDVLKDGRIDQWMANGWCGSKWFHGVSGL